jgi:hypothetical protein
VRLTPTLPRGVISSTRLERVARVRFVSVAPAHLVQGFGQEALLAVVGTVN